MGITGCTAAVAVKAMVMVFLLESPLAADNILKVQIKADILFVVDYSGSVKVQDVQNLKRALYNVVNMLDISNDTVNIGILTYSCEVSIQLNLSMGTSKDAVIQSINDLPEDGEGWNLVGASLDKAVEIFKDEARNNSIKILVIISDGSTTCLPTELAPCFGNQDDWDLAQCRTKSRQCAKPKDYLCILPVADFDCGFESTDSVVYDQAELLKAQYGVWLVTVILRDPYDDDPNDPYLVNMNCWANDNMNFSVMNYKELADKLADMVKQVIKKNPPKDCRYFEQSSPQCSINASGKGTEYECIKKVTVIQVEAEEPGGKPCPKNQITKVCNLEDCYQNATKGSVVYYAIKLVKVKRKKRKESPLLLILLVALILILIGTVIGIAILLVILLKRERRHGKSMGVQMTIREPLTSKGRSERVVVDQSGPKSASSRTKQVARS